MSIVQGVHGSASWSSTHTLPAFPQRGSWYTPGLRTRMTLSDILFFGSLIALPVLARPAGALAGGAVRVAAGSSRLAGVGATARWGGSALIRGLGFVKRPIHTTMAAASEYTWSAGTSMALRGAASRGLVVRSLGWRKKGNMVLLGVSMIDPLENLTYIRNRDWTRLFINYHLPFIGVPIWNQTSWSDGSTWSSSGGGEPGEIPSFHRPPPSIEEIGNIISHPHIVVEVAESSITKPKPSRTKCPPGHFFNKHTGKCQAYIEQPKIRYVRGKG